MDPCIHTYYVDLRNGIEIHRERQPLAVGDRNADRYYVHVQKCGKRYDLTGAVVIGKVLRPDQHTVLLDGDVIDGAAVITLDEHCYAVPGEIKLTVVISAGGVTNAVMILTAEVLPSESDSIVENETVGSLADLAEILADLKDHNVRGTLDAVQDCVYPIPVDVHWVSGPVLGLVGMPTSVISTEQLDGSCYRVIADDGIEHRWWYYYDGYDANDSDIGTSQWLDGDSLAAEHVPGAAENVRVSGVKIEFRKADGTEVDDFSEITDYVSVMTTASLETVLYTAQELTEEQKEQARRNIGAMPADTEIPAPYQLPAATADTLGGVKVGSGLQMDGDVLLAEAKKADVDRLSENMENYYLHQAGFLYEPTEGLTDADAFPYNTIYTINQGANVANIPERAGGTLITFGSTNTNNGAVQLFNSVYSVLYVRSRRNKAYTSWVRLADDDRIQTFINSNNNSIVGMKTGDLITSVQEAPLDNANTYPANTIYSFSLGSNLVANLPSPNGTLMTFNYSNAAAVCKCQIFITQYGTLYNRINWSNTWTAWKMYVTEANLSAAKTECKTYADNIKKSYIDEYVSLSMFEKFGVIGDSYSSGAIYVLNEDGSQKSAGTYYNLSWGQIMARKLGTTCTNFSKGGLSTRTWLTDDKGLPLLLSSDPQNIYYLMLGINDKGKHGVEYIGTIADIKTDHTQNADTFYGNYGKIISNIKAHAPNAKIIMSTMTGKSGANKSFNDAIESIAAHFGIPCVKQYENNFFNSDFYKNNIVVDHPTAPVYSGMANALQKMFEDAVRGNVAYFNDYVG